MKYKEGKIMSFKIINPLPSPEELASEYPISYAGLRYKKERDLAIRNILSGVSSQFLMIVGPCSADNMDALLDYTSRLAALQEIVKDKILFVPRLYSSKPRTLGIGYKGLLHQPNPQKKDDIFQGLIATRKLHLEVLEQTGLTGADEILYPDNWEYLSDIVSYIAVGARSVEDQFHRFTVSGCDIPCGMKNPTNGNLSSMTHAIFAAQHSQNFIYRGNEVETSGNPFTHGILRGMDTPIGEKIPNYHLDSIQNVSELFHQQSIENPALIIDTNHSNSNKKYMEQIRISKDIISLRNQSPLSRKIIKGLMIESYLEDGSQPEWGTTYGQSITDPCLGWDKTKRLILELSELL